MAEPLYWDIKGNPVYAPDDGGERPIVINGRVAVRDAFGEGHTIPVDKLDDALKLGARPESYAEHNERRLEHQYGGRQIEATARGALSTFTFGGSDAVFHAIDPEAAAEIPAHNKTGTAVGSIAAAFAPLGAPGLIAKAGRATQEALAGTSAIRALATGGGVARTVAKAAPVLGQMALEGGLYGGGQATANVALSKEPMSAEAIAAEYTSGIGTGALGGVVLGGLGHAIGSAASEARGVASGLLARSEARAAGELGSSVDGVVKVIAEKPATIESAAAAGGHAEYRAKVQDAAAGARAHVQTLSAHGDQLVAEVEAAEKAGTATPEMVQAKADFIATGKAKPVRDVIAAADGTDAELVRAVEKDPKAAAEALGQHEVAARNLAKRLEPEPPPPEMSAQDLAERDAELQRALSPGEAKRLDTKDLAEATRAAARGEKLAQRLEEPGGRAFEGPGYERVSTPEMPSGAKLARRLDDPAFANTMSEGPATIRGGGPGTADTLRPGQESRGVKLPWQPPVTEIRYPSSVLAPGPILDAPRPPGVPESPIFASNPTLRNTMAGRSTMSGDTLRTDTANPAAMSMAGEGGPPQDAFAFERWLKGRVQDNKATGNLRGPAPAGKTLGEGAAAPGAPARPDPLRGFGRDEGELTPGRGFRADQSHRPLFGEGAYDPAEAARRYVKGEPATAPTKTAAPATEPTQASPGAPPSPAGSTPSPAGGTASAASKVKALLEEHLGDLPTAKRKALLHVAGGMVMSALGVKGMLAKLAVSYASHRLLGKLEGAVSRTSETLAAGVDKALGIAVKGGTTIKALAPVSAKVLQNVSFTGVPLPVHANPQHAVKALVGQLAVVVSNPDQARSYFAKLSEGIRAVDVDLGHQVENLWMKRAQYLAASAPKDPGIGTITEPSKWIPSPAQATAMLRRVAATLDPHRLLAEIAAGKVTTETVEATKSVYPEYLAKAQELIMRGLAHLKETGKSPPKGALRGLSMVTGTPLESSQRPDYVAAMQANFKIQAYNAAQGAGAGSVYKNNPASQFTTVQKQLGSAQQ